VLVKKNSKRMVIIGVVAAAACIGGHLLSSSGEDAYYVEEMAWHKYADIEPGVYWSLQLSEFHDGHVEALKEKMHQDGYSWYQIAKLEERATQKSEAKYEKATLALKKIKEREWLESEEGKWFEEWKQRHEQ
jgi:hypothetical protein